MNKSTPLNELPNINNSPPNMNMEMESNSKPTNIEDKENQIVSEILNEIDNNNKNNESHKQNEINHSHQNNLQASNEQELLQQQMMQQQILNNQTMNMESNLDNSLQNVRDGLAKNAIELLKQPVVVALVIALISIPKFNSVLTDMISKNSKLLAYSTFIVLVLKALLGGILYFGINRYVN